MRTFKNLEHATKVLNIEETHLIECKWDQCRTNKWETILIKDNPLKNA